MEKKYRVQSMFADHSKIKLQTNKEKKKKKHRIHIHLEIKQKICNTIAQRKSHNGS